MFIVTIVTLPYLGCQSPAKKSPVLFEKIFTHLLIYLLKVRAETYSCLAKMFENLGRILDKLLSFFQKK